jgi:hypothetical protein
MRQPLDLALFQFPDIGFMHSRRSMIGRRFAHLSVPDANESLFSTA